MPFGEPTNFAAYEINRPIQLQSDGTRIVIWIVLHKYFGTTAQRFRLSVGKHHAVLLHGQQSNKNMTYPRLAETTAAREGAILHGRAQFPRQRQIY